jgi:hypothetical protein
MATRINNATTQHFNKLSPYSPLSGGQMFFYESGSSTTLKDTFSDTDGLIANTNPVILDAAGFEPNIYGDGSYRVVLKSSTTDGSLQQWVRDPVVPDSTGELGRDWDPLTTYDVSSIVTYNGILYTSIISNNINNIPSSVASAWTQFDLVKRWNTNETYGARDPVIATDFIMYLSLVSSNVGNDPVTDGGVNWRPTSDGVFSDWDSSTTYGIGGDNIRAGSDGNYYESITAGNLNNDPVSSPANWTRINFTKIWNTNETYGVDDLVTGSDSQVYQAVISNSATDPTSDDGTNWLPRHNVFDNLTLSGNAISSTDTNGDIVLTPDGTGVVTTDNLSFNGNTIASTDANGDIDLAPNGTGQATYNGDEVQIVPAAIAGYTVGSNIYLAEDGAGGSNVFVTSVVTASVSETFGPTSSGADNIWTALDDLPAGATGVFLSFESFMTLSGTSAAQLSVYARDGGGSAGSSTSQQVSYNAAQGASGEDFGNQSAVFVPVDSSGIFSILWLSLNTSTDQVTMTMKGFLV